MNIIVSLLTGVLLTPIVIIIYVVVTIKWINRKIIHKIIKNPSNRKKSQNHRVRLFSDK